jgi:hypothetical protein
MTEKSTKEKRVSDIIGDGKIDFHPEYARIELSEILGRDVMIMDARIMKDWPSEYTASGKASWCLIWVQDMETGENYTTKCGGVVLTKRIGELIGKKCFPIIGSIVTAGDEERPYYNVI